MSRVTYRRWAAALLAVLAFGGGMLAWRALTPVPPDGAGSAPPLVVPVGDHQPGTVQFVQGIWIARQPDGEFYVFLNRDPHKGQPLNWVESKGLFMQAAWYGIDGRCLGGPCDPSPGQGLYRVHAELQGQDLVIQLDQVISGGLDPEPAWLTDLKHFIRSWLPF